MVYFNKFNTANKNSSNNLWFCLLSTVPQRFFKYELKRSFHMFTIVIEPEFKKCETLRNIGCSSQIHNIQTNIGQL